MTHQGAYQPLSLPRAAINFAGKDFRGSEQQSLWAVPLCPDHHLCRVCSVDPRDSWAAVVAVVVVVVVVGQE